MNALLTAAPYIALTGCLACAFIITYRLKRLEQTVAMLVHVMAHEVGELEARVRKLEE